MSNLTNVVEQLAKLPNEQSQAIVALIDIKTEDDMEKVLNKLDSMSSKLEAMDSKFEAKFDAMDSKFEAMDSKFDAMDSKINALESKIYNIRWFIMGSIAVAGLVIEFWDKIPIPTP